MKVTGEIQQGLNRRNYILIYISIGQWHSNFCVLFLSGFFLERPYQWQLKNGEKWGPCLRSMWLHKLRKQVKCMFWKRSLSFQGFSLVSPLQNFETDTKWIRTKRKKRVSKLPWASVSSMRGSLQKVLLQIGFACLNLCLYPVPHALKAQTVISSPFFLNRNHTKKISMYQFLIPNRKVF